MFTAATIGYQRSINMSSLPGSLDKEQWAEVMLRKWYGPYKPHMFLEKLMPVSKPVLRKMRQDVEFPAPACDKHNGFDVEPKDDENFVRADF